MIGPAFPPELLKKKQKQEQQVNNTDEIAMSVSDDESSATVDTVGPQIPAHLLKGQRQTQDNSNSDEINIPDEEGQAHAEGASSATDIGPQIPAHLLKQKATVSEQQKSSDEIHISDDEGPIGPALPASSKSTAPPPPSSPPSGNEDNDDNNVNPDDFVPALPPELMEERRQRQQQQQQQQQGGRRRAPIGPALPPGPMPMPAPAIDDDESIVGPVLPSATDYNPEEAAKLSAIQAIEQRARQSKEAMEEKKRDTGKVERPEWMLVPPEVDYLKNANSGRSRGFASGSSSTMSAAERDSSSWTETPAERERRLAEEQITGVKRKAAGASNEPQLSPSPLDLEKKRQVEQFNMQSRPMSLLEMHQQNRKKKKKSSKLTEEEDVTKRAFDRDKDLLAPRQMDTKQKKEFLKQTAQMGRNFGYGAGGSFL